ISPIKWKLDNEGYGVWTNASATLTLSTAGGALDALLPNLAGARAEVYAGAKLPNGGEEFIKIFRGFALAEPVTRERERSVTLTISGELARLASYGAQDISITQTAELLGQNAGTDLRTAHIAAGQILEVRRGPLAAGYEEAQTLKEETDFEISDLHSPRRGALIKLAAPLSEGQAVWAAYRRWHTDVTLTWIAQEIARRSESAPTQIEQPQFEADIVHAFTQPALYAFAEGEHSYTQEEQGKVTLKDSFLDLAQHDWVIKEKPSNVNFTLTPSSVALNPVNFTGRATVAAAAAIGAYGTWEAEVSGGLLNNHEQVDYFISSADERNTTCGYVFIKSRLGAQTLICNLCRVDNGAIILLNRVTLSGNSEALRYRISRDSAGNFRLWAKVSRPTPAASWQSFGIIATDNTYTQNNYQLLSFSAYGSAVYELKQSAAVAAAEDAAPNGSYTSPVLDGGANLSSWDAFTIQQELNGAAAQIYWRAKPAPQAPWGAWAQITSGQTPPTTERYLQLQWRASRAQAEQKPYLISWQISSRTTGINIAVLNTSSMTFLDVMRELALLTGFQIGYDTEGKFLFKSRNAGASVLSITEADIIELQTLAPGWDKLYNRVSVNFGQYSRAADAFSEQEPRPNLIDRFGLKELTLTSGALLPPQNANLARAVAPPLYRQVSAVKKRASALVRFLPYIELGDIAQVTYKTLLNCPMRVEGLEFDLDAWALRLDLTEV
ncbi:MAG: hypothetical protein LBR90_04725, partial [Elusimicrobiota bacterium]|nr:hypothetical protein [Elusimicrobiota bacterium]